MQKEKKQGFELFLSTLKKVNLKLNLKNTIQKEYILKVLYFSNKHLTVEEIKQTVNNDYNIKITKATIYKIIKNFEELNFINTLEVINSPKRFELNLSCHHDHIICTNCQNILEFYDEEIEKKQKEIAKKYNFTLHSHSMIIYGLCKNCK